jgi:hypothetical protein
MTRSITYLMVPLYVIVFIIACIFSFDAYPHDKDRPELNIWFDHLASKKGMCCSYADGFALADPDWESSNGHYRVRIPDMAIPGNPLKWVEVPDEAVITEPNKDGRTMVWPMFYFGVITIRCFMPGPLT